MKVLFVSSGNKKSGISPIVKAQGESLRKENVKINYYLIEGKGFIGYLKNLLPLKREIKCGKYDIIHSHYGDSTILAAIANFNKVKFIISFMGDDLYGSLNKNYKYTLKSKFFTKINKILAKYVADGVIVKSHKMNKKLFSSTNSSIIPNGVNMNQFNCIKANKNNNCKIILFISNVNRPEKNYKLLKEAIKYVDDKNIHVKNVHNVSKEELKLEYNNSKVLVLTSIHEGSPNVIKEAMACNCPIVSTDIGDVKWVFGDTKGCYLTSFDPLDIANKIKRALIFSDKKGRTDGRNRIFDLGLDSVTIAKKIIVYYEQC